MRKIFALLLAVCLVLTASCAWAAGDPRELVWSSDVTGKWSEIGNWKVSKDQDLTPLTGSYYPGKATNSEDTVIIYNGTVSVDAAANEITNLVGLKLTSDDATAKVTINLEANLPTSGTDLDLLISADSTINVNAYTATFKSISFDAAATVADALKLKLTGDGTNGKVIVGAVTVTPDATTAKTIATKNTDGTILISGATAIAHSSTTPVAIVAGEKAYVVIDGIKLETNGATVTLKSGDMITADGTTPVVAISDSDTTPTTTTIYATSITVNEPGVAIDGTLTLSKTTEAAVKKKVARGTKGFTIAATAKTTGVSTTADEAAKITAGNATITLTGNDTVALTNDGASIAETGTVTSADITGATVEKATLDGGSVDGATLSNVTVNGDVEAKNNVTLDGEITVAGTLTLAEGTKLIASAAGATITVTGDGLVVDSEGTVLLDSEDGTFKLEADKTYIIENGSLVEENTGGGSSNSSGGCSTGVASLALLLAIPMLLKKR